MTTRRRAAARPAREGNDNTSSGGGGASSGGESGSGGTSSGGATPTRSTHFADTNAVWTLPAGAPYGSGYDAVATAKWSTMDLDGDRKPNLVVPADATESKRSWKVYKNTP